MSTVAWRDNEPMSTNITPAHRHLFDFSSGDAAAPWSAIDDAVMGGVSHSRLRDSGYGYAIFEGKVSLAHGSGFASVRCRPLPLGLAGATVCLIEVSGDGREYKLNLRTVDGFDGVNYQIRFLPPNGEWGRISLPLADFAPSWRGRPVPDAPALDPAGIRQVGLMIADKQAGPFRLAVRSIALAGTADPGSGE